MSYITLNKNWRLSYDGEVFIPEEWDEGGKEIRNPKTREVRLSESQWKKHSKYYKELKNAVKFCCAHESNNNKESYHSLQEYVEYFNDTFKEMMLEAEAP